METIKLVDYKGKYDIGIDDDRIDDMDIVVGEIVVEDFINELPDRKEACQYYGIPVYIGKNKKILEALTK